MRIAVALLAAALPVAAMAQSEQREDPDRVRVEVTGCVKGSTLTETNLAMPSSVRDEAPARRWRIRGSKPLMKQIKEHTGRELRIVGTSKNAQSGTAVGGTRVGRTNIYIGGNIKNGSRDPLPEQPTLDVESFEATGQTCQ